ncbi:hypothetical protein J437_LFUL009818 [Ladona fulva]|uniref:Apoptosis inhibitor 5 n=1 Tax=Ladona fulva TaxID=123851 RepID=A0A8K0KE92_LADFU|nr:hypothetical protein J437_LFUL009818 [Ladona fulva]
MNIVKVFKMSENNIAKLYKKFAILADAKDKIGEHEKEYLEILTAVKGSDKEKRLASQFIARFFKHFPNLSDQAIEAQLDLCEDEDVAIRKQAIKDLPNLCKDNKEYTQKIADILAQLLQAEDINELSVVHNSLMSVLKTDAKSALAGVFSQIIKGEDVIRERTLKFLTTKIKVLSAEVMTKDAEDFMIAECKKVLQVFKMSENNIAKLYKKFAILADAKDKIGEHEKEYLEILTAVKGSDKEKRLASQFIARFFKHFPNLSDQAIEAQLDLCEDEDVAIRKQAIKDLPNLCKDNKEYTQKIADILAQLLQAEDINELSVVHNSLMSVLKTDAKSALAGVFSQIIKGEDVIRERTLKFLTTKIKVLSAEVMTKDAEDFMIAECKKVLQDVTAEEFRQVMEILCMTRLGKTASGQQELVSLIAEQAELDRGSFNPNDPEGESVERLLHCLRYALPYFSAQVDSSQYVSYICEHVLPVLSEIPSGEDELQLEILKLLAELCSHCNTIENPESKVEKIFKKLIENMPLPPDDAEGINGGEEPRLEFSQVECLMYSFHRLARHCPDFLASNVDRLKDFRFRLQYFARGIQGYIKKLREALQGKQGDELKTDENRIKVVALKTTSNINTLIKDLFHSPPSYKSVISLSWKPTVPVNQKAAPAAGQKRHTPITFGESPNSKHLKSEREIYQPPSGKYSNKVSSYTPRRGRGRGGPRGGFSNRGGRGWRRGY